MAIVMWSSMALLSAATQSLPPLELMSLTFCVAPLLLLVRAAGGKVNLSDLLRQPRGAWIAGVGTFFAYHFCYFLAVRKAPVVEASLINYLWPLCIVLFASFVPGARPRWRPIMGGLLGLLGTYVLLMGGVFLAFGAHLWGDLAAAAAALIWATYSVFNRRYHTVPTDAVALYCGSTAILAWIVHALVEPTIMPQGAQWLTILALGLGPVGAAFYAWDYGIKRGNLRVLGTLSYATPLLSTILLVLSGRTSLTPSVFWSCLLVVAGGVLAASGDADKTAEEIGAAR